MDRSAFNGGPAFFTHDGTSWQVENDDWEAASEIMRQPVRSNLQGKLGDREDYSITTVKATPIAFSGTLAALHSKLFPFSPSHIGSMLFSGTNKPLVIQTKDGKSITYSAAAMKTPPELQWLAGKSYLSGDAEWIALRKNNTDASDASSHVAVATSAYTEPTIDPSTIVNSRFTMSWGEDAPFDSIECDSDGAKLRVTYEWEELGTWNDGLVNYRLKNVEAVLSFTPVNVDAADFFDAMLALDGSNAGRGKFLSTRGLPLTITGAAVGDPTLVIPNAVAVKGSARFGGRSRIGAIEMHAQRVFDSGLQPLFTLGTVPETP